MKDAAVIVAAAYLALATALSCSPAVTPHPPPPPLDEPNLRTTPYEDDDGADDVCMRSGRVLWQLGCKEARPRPDRWGPFCRGRYPGPIDADCIAMARTRAALRACSVRCLPDPNP